MQNEIKKVDNETIKRDREFQENELSEKQERTKNRKTLFYSILASSAILMIISVLLAIYIIVCSNATTQEVAVLAMLITAPIILVLALMRYIYDGRKIDDPQPTLMLNIGKEFAGVLTSIFKK